MLCTSKHPTTEEKARWLVAPLHRPQMHADAITVRTKSQLRLALVQQVVATIAIYDKEITRLF